MGKRFFSIGDQIGRNVIIFWVDMSSSLHADNKKKCILILGKGPTKGFFTKQNKKFYLSLY